MAYLIGLAGYASATYDTNLGNVVFLILLILLIVGRLESGFILVWIARHETLDGDEDRLETLRRGPFFAPFTPPCAVKISPVLPFTTQ